MQILKIILPLTLFSVYCASSVHGKLHEYMTQEEIRSIFVDDLRPIEEIEYEVVPIFHKKPVHQKRNRHIQMKAFNSNFMLSLENNDNVLLSRFSYIFIPYLLRDEIVRYAAQPYPDLRKIETYQDIKTRAALVFHTDDDNKVHVHGTIGNNIVLRSLPPRVHKDILNKNPSTYEAHKPSPGFSSDQTLHHIVFKSNTISLRNWPNITEFSLEVGNSVDLYAKLATLQQTKVARVNRKINSVNKYQLDKLDPTESNKVMEKINSLNAQIAQWNHDSSWNIESINNQILELELLIETVTYKIQAKTPTVPIAYPKLLVSVDFSTYRLHGESVENVALYMAAFWNSVDLRFRELKDPQIRLHISGLVIHTKEGIAPYTDLYTKECGIKSVDDTKILRQSDEHYFVHFRHLYDLIVDVTDHRICNVHVTETGKISFPILGSTYLSAACQHHHKKELMARNKKLLPAAAVVHDRGGFDGVIVAAHELGHAMGSLHDKEEEYKNLNYGHLLEHFKTGGKCAWENGHIMSYKANSTNTFHFSECSKELITNFVNSYSGQCLTSKPSIGEVYPRILAGKIKDRNQQCLNSAGLYAYTINDIATQPELLMGNETAYVNDCTVLYCSGLKNYYNVSNYYDVIVYRVPIPASADRQAPADGSSCGFQKICLNGICIDDPTKKIKEN